MQLMNACGNKPRTRRRARSDSATTTPRGTPPYRIPEMSTLSTSVTVQNWYDTRSLLSRIPHSSRGVWFDVQSEGPPLRITAILAACSDFVSGQVVVYGSEEGSGVGKERERGAWGQLAVGTLQDCSKGATRLVLSSPVSVRSALASVSG